MQREEPDAGQFVAALVPIRASQELVAAADGQEGRAVCHRGPQPVSERSERGRDQLLLAVLAAPDVEQIVLALRKRTAGTERPHLELVPAPRRAAREHRDVPAVGVDVQVIRKEVPDDELHAAASQYGLTSPRRATISRSASIAV